MERKRRASRHELEDAMGRLSSAFHRDVIFKRRTNECLPSISELAATYGVNVSTSWKFYQGLLQSGVIGSERRKGYFLKDASRFLRQYMAGKEVIVGIVGFLDASDPLAAHNPFTQAIGAFERMANEHGWRTQFYNCFPHREMPMEVLDAIERDKGELSAILHIPDSSCVMRIETLRKFGVPLLTIEETAVGAAYIAYDDCQIGAAAAKYLFELGHRRAGYVGHRGQPWSVERQRAFIETLANHGTPVNNAWVLELGTTGKAVLMECAEKLREQRVTAVFCANDAIAVELINVGEEVGWRTAGSVAVIGVDDSLASQQMGLSTVQKSYAVIGEVAFKTFVSHLEGGEPLPMKTLLHGTLLKRGSTEFISTMDRRNTLSTTSSSVI